MKILKNEKKLKFLIAMLSVAMITLGCVSISAFADEAKGGNQNEGTKTTAKTASNDENVYVMTDASGAEHQRIVSERGTLHYSGYEECNMPVTFSIEYNLDGKTLTPDQIAGKSGHVVMTVKYANHQKSGAAYVPFMAVTGMILDNSCFSNVKIVNGKTLDDGNRNIVVGYGLPGMGEALGISANNINIPESFTVSADVDKFQIDTIYTLVTSDPFKDMKLDKVSSIEELKGEMSKLESGAQELLSGTNKIYEGSSLVAQGINTLDSQLSAGITEKEKTAASQQAVATVDRQLDDNSQTMNYNNIKASAANTFYKSIANEQVISNAKQMVAAGLQSKLSGIETTASNAAKEQVKNSLAGNTQLQDVQKLLTAGYQMAELQDPEVQLKIQQQVQESAAQIGKLIESGYSQEQATQFVTAAFCYQAIMSDATKAAAAQSAVETSGVLTQSIVDTAGTVAATTAGSVASQVAADVTGQVVTAVASQAMNTVGTSVAESVRQASETAAAQGAVSGVNSTKLNIAKNIEEQGLVSGANQLAAGAKQLNEGVKELVSKAMSKLSSLSSSDLVKVMNNINSVGNAAKGYNSFGGKGSYNSVKFIYKTDAISLK